MTQHVPPGDFFKLNFERVSVEKQSPRLRELIAKRDTLTAAERDEALKLLLQAQVETPTEEGRSR